MEKLKGNALAFKEQIAETERAIEEIVSITAQLEKERNEVSDCLCVLEENILFYFLRTT